VQNVEHLAGVNGGLYRYAAEGKRLEPPVKFLDRPGHTGHSWDVKSGIDTGKLAGSFKIGILPQITVQAGTFRNVVTCSSNDLNASGTRISVRYYFAKDIGLIKQVVNLGGQELIIELEKFEVGGPS
jgi:hypothetical protein